MAPKTFAELMSDAENCKANNIKANSKTVRPIALDTKMSTRFIDYSAADIGSISSRPKQNGSYNSIAKAAVEFVDGGY